MSQKVPAVSSYLHKQITITHTGKRRGVYIEWKIEMEQKESRTMIGHEQQTFHRTCLHTCARTHMHFDNMWDTSTHSCRVLLGSWPSCRQAAQPCRVCQAKSRQKERDGLSLRSMCYQSCHHLNKRILKRRGVGCVRYSWCSVKMATVVTVTFVFMAQAQKQFQC